ncbi:hypothetical protein HA052_07105 [Chromobacterium haemolyticum]|uniref:Uncharacterized protein n=1 Tax=Chromobacterium fluminis TaxID=3044269 RepID=A0ABX0L657_9NEIS|nr:hypothetical protein [Chromobacterium haemolyticum]NHR04964.1 hypothetical protein [Chromobacterium haemolyticum]
MTPFSPSTFAKPPPAAQLRQLSQTLDACALALNGFSQLRSTLTAIQAQTTPSSHQHLLACLSIEVLDNYASQLKHINATAQSEQQSLSPT